MDASELSRDYDATLSASIFDVYDEQLVPLAFQPYADDMARRLSDLRAGSVLEVAAGTGVVTRALAAELPDTVSITAGDLVPGMLDRAQRIGTIRPVAWEQANVMALPYEPDSFDAVVCQFGAMFFESKSDAFAEVHRVLRPGGRFLFSVWDGFDRNPFAAAINDAMQQHFPDDPPRFLERKPYSYHDLETIRADLAGAGFGLAPVVERVEHVSSAATASQVATAFCGGTPLRDEIVGRGPELLADVITTATAAVAERFGAVDPSSRMSAQVVITVR